VPPVLTDGVVLVGGAVVVVAAGEVVVPVEQLTAIIETINTTAKAKMISLGNNLIVFIFLSLNAVPPKSVYLFHKPVRHNILLFYTS